MKSYLLLLAASLAATSISAQELKTFQLSQTKQAKDMSVMSSQKLNLLRKSRGTAANPTVYYNRPKGTLFSFMDLEGKSYAGNFAAFPAYASIKFVNASSNKAATTWNINSKPVTDGVDADKNLTKSFISTDKEHIIYMPTLVNGTDSFSLAISQDGGIVCPSYKSFFMPVQWDDNYYYGGQGPTPFYGDRTNIPYDGKTYNQTAFYEVYDKPITSFTLCGLNMFAWAKGDIKTQFKDVKVEVRNVITDEQGNKTPGENVLATLSFVPDSVHFSKDWPAASGYTVGIMSFYPMADDGFGGQAITPIDLTDEFALSVSGFSGKNIGIYFAQAPDYSLISSTETSYNFDTANLPEPAHFIGTADDGSTVDLSYRYYAYPLMGLYGYQNNAHFETSPSLKDGTTLNLGEFDAPTTGGYVTQGSVNLGALLFTALPWADADGNTNYTVNIDYDGQTPWLNQHEDGTDENQKFVVNTQDYSEEGYNILFFYADPLPAGTTGRHAVVTVNANGAISNKIVIRQGDDKTTGINTVSTNADVKTNNAVYNLEGQKVTKDYKGIVIENGVKRLNK